MALGDGTGWDTNSPADGDAISAGPTEIKDLRTGVEIRLNKEHVLIEDASRGGEHLEGSALCYYAATAPPNRPDGTELAAADEGRIWVDSDEHIPYVWTGSTWVKIRGFNHVPVTVAGSGLYSYLPRIVSGSYTGDDAATRTVQIVLGASGVNLQIEKVEIWSEIGLNHYDVVAKFGNTNAGGAIDMDSFIAINHSLSDDHADFSASFHATAPLTDAIILKGTQLNADSVVYYFRAEMRWHLSFDN